MLLKITLISCLLLFLVTPVLAQSETTGDANNPPKASLETSPKTSPETSEAATASQSSSSPGWEFSVAPYFFLARLDGTVGVRGQTAQVSASFPDIFRNLDFAIMGQVEARKGNWSILGDAMYMSLSGKKVTPNPLFGDIDVEVKETIIEPAVAYRVLKAERGSIDLVGGVRFWHVKPHLTFQPRILPLVDVEQSKSWADPIVGARGTTSLSPRVFLLGRFDVGGFGIKSDFSGQAFGGAGFQVKPRIALIGGYRVMRVDYTDDGFVFRTTMSGILLGAKFKL